MHQGRERIPLSHQEASNSCPLCNKTFAQESSRKRHYYYCRSKLPDTNRSRRRSCAACVSAKTRCIVLNSTSSETCVRCRERNAECEFAVSARRNDDCHTGEEGSVPGASHHTSNEAETHGNTTSLAVTRPSKRSKAGSFTTASLEWLTETSWDAGPGVIDISGLQDPLCSDQSIESLLYPFNEQSSIFEQTIPNLTPWDLYCSSLFEHRTFSKPNHSPLLSLAKQISRSYPFMMLQKTAPPPFVHRFQLSWAETGKGPSQQSLVTCIGLVQLFKSRTEANKSLVWRLIKLEQERILAAHLAFDKWELLAAFQSLLVYCLLRLQEVPVDNNGFDAAILTTVNLVFNELASSAGGIRRMTLPDHPDMTWMDWVYNESRRRTVLVFQILNVLIEMSTEASVYPTCGFVLLPLAQSAALWNATDSGEWRTEFDLSNQERKLHGLSQTGVLSKLELRLDEDCVVLSSVEWEEWKADVGEIGALVMIVGALL